MRENRGGELAGAVRDNNLNKVISLLRSGFDPNDASDSFVSAVQLAAEQGYKDIVLYLYVAGAQHDFSDRENITPIFHFVETILADAEKYYLSADKNRNQLLASCYLLDETLKSLSLRCEMQEMLNFVKDYPEIKGFLLAGGEFRKEIFLLAKQHYVKRENKSLCFDKDFAEILSKLSNYSELKNAYKDMASLRSVSRCFRDFVDLGNDISLFCKDNLFEVMSFVSLLDMQTIMKARNLHDTHLGELVV